MKEKLAFDVSRYSELSGFAEDLAGWVLEADKNKQWEERVNTFTLHETKDGRVVSPALGDKDVIYYYSREGELEEKETLAGLEIRECLLNQPLGTISVWISPPGGLSEYDEGRMVVGVNKEDGGLRLIESYGISNDFLADECLEISLKLNKISIQSYNLNVPEDIRDKVFLINDYQGSPWNFLSEIIPLKKVWELIENGEAKKAKEEALKDAWEIALSVKDSLRQAESKRDYLYVGAMAEKMMEERGRKVFGGSCGATNNEMMDFFETGLFTHLEINIDGVVSDGSGEAGKFVKQCPKCQREIGRVIKEGYQCECGGVYEGC